MTALQELEQAISGKSKEEADTIKEEFLEGNASITVLDTHFTIRTSTLFRGGVKVFEYDPSGGSMLGMPHNVTFYLLFSDERLALPSTFSPYSTVNGRNMYIGCYSDRGDRAVVIPNSGLFEPTEISIFRRSRDGRFLIMIHSSLRNSFNRKN